QVDGLIDQALKVANSQPDGKSLFGGAAVTTQPFSVATTDSAGRPATITYNGSTDRTQTLTGPGQTVDTRYVGSEVFQQSGADVFQSLISLSDNLRDTTLTGDARSQAFAQNVTDLDAARNGIGNVTAEQSSSLATLQSVQNLTDDLKTNADQRVGDLQGT